MRRAIEGAHRGRRSEDHLRSLQVQDGPGRNHRARNHSANEIKVAIGASDGRPIPMISVFDLFKIGIGPSSSHTMGPMKAAAAFMAALERRQRASLKRLKVTLLGSLAWTGKGHRTDKAVMLGLSGLLPESIDPDDADRPVDGIAATWHLMLADGTTISFEPAMDYDINITYPAPLHPLTT